jgi:hypothetical protein
MIDSIGSVLDRLDAQAGQNTLARDAARVIRRLMEQISTTEAELLETEFSRFAYVVEFERMRDLRSSFEARKAMKVGKR